MQERRRFVRLPTQLPVTYQLLPSTQTHQALTKQIGIAGTCLVLQETIRHGGLLRVTFTFPDAAQPLSLTGKVVWCERCETIGQTGRNVSFEAGVQFVQVDESDVVALANFMASLLPSSPPS